MWENCRKNLDRTSVALYKKISENDTFLLGENPVKYD
jgi:hypothetical protein